MEKENSVYFNEIEVDQKKYIVGKPSICYINLPNYCHMRCKMCSFWKNKITVPSVSLKQWEDFFSSLKNFLGLGRIQVSIAGGESFLYKDIFALTKMIVDFGFGLHITSNGYLINESIAKKIAESKLQSIGISLDGFSSQTHDYLRGRKNSFNRVMNAIKYLRNSSSSLQIGIMTIIMERNKEEIISLVKWVQENKDLDYINFHVIMQPFGEDTDTGWHNKDSYKELWPQDVDKICELLTSLIELKNSVSPKIANTDAQLEFYKTYFKGPDKLIRRNQVCNFIDYGINIDYYGGIHLCNHYDLIGDIFHDFSKTYNSPRAQEARRQIILCKKNCHRLINNYIE